MSARGVDPHGPASRHRRIRSNAAAQKQFLEIGP